MNTTVEASISTLEVVRAGWPIVVGLILGLLFIVRLAQDIAREATLNKAAREDFSKFRADQYPKDRDGIFQAIREVRDAQDKSEVRIESKIDKLSDQSNVQLEKVYAKISETNILLAKMEGRWSSTGTGPNKS